MDDKNQQSFLGRFLIPFLIAFIGSKVIFSAINFQYLIFQEPFHIGKLIVDIGTFCILFIIGVVLTRYFKIGIKQD